MSEILEAFEEIGSKIFEIITSLPEYASEGLGKIGEFINGLLGGF